MHQVLGRGVAGVGARGVAGQAGRQQEQRLCLVTVTALRLQHLVKVQERPARGAALQAVADGVAVAGARAGGPAGALRQLANSRRALLGTLLQKVQQDQTVGRQRVQGSPAAAGAEDVAGVGAAGAPGEGAQPGQQVPRRCVSCGGPRPARPQTALHQQQLCKAPAVLGQALAHHLPLLRLQLCQVAAQ